MSGMGRTPTGRGTIPTTAALIVTFLPAALAAQIPGGRASNMSVERATFRAAMLKEIRPRMESWMDAWRGQGDATIESHYSDDAVLVLPGSAAVGSPEEIAGLVQAARKNVAALNTSMLDFAASDGMAYVYGTFDAPWADGSVGAHGNVLTVWTKAEGGWLIRSQMFASDSLSPPLVVATARPKPLPAIAVRVAPTDSAGTSRRKMPVADKGPDLRRTATYRELISDLASLRRAWGEGNVQALKGLMVDDAWLVLPGQGGTGGALSPQELDKVLPEYGSLNTAEVDFESSGTLAYLSGRYYVQRRSGPAASGVYTAVFQNLGSGWQIRSLVFF